MCLKRFKVVLGIDDYLSSGRPEEYIYTHRGQTIALTVVERQCVPSEVVPVFWTGC
jgi:predicted nucleic acid-binding OB-fold protein